MKDIGGIKDTIAKLLALAGSPNENEARVALMKARAMMAKYKLREEDVQHTKNMKVIKELSGITCTKMTNSWAVELSSIIAENYCCTAFRQHVKYEKSVSIGLVGLEDDFEVCLKIFKFAFDCVASACKQIRKEYKGFPISEIRQMETAYGTGFCNGLMKMYREQNKEYQEYALALTVPQVVMDAVSHMKEGGAYRKHNLEAWQMPFASQGFHDGQEFNPSTKLPEAQEC